MRRDAIIAWLPIATLPTAVAYLTPDDWPRWVFMWLFAGALFAGCKWLTWWSDRGTGVSAGRQIGYLAGWPGLDAAAFLHSPCLNAPPLVTWLFALGKFGLGAVLIAVVYPRLPTEYDLLRGWVGMVGIVFALHVGTFHLLGLIWQTLGVNAKPIMDWPMLATSVSDFWGKRWNLAFRDLTHRFLFRPLTARFGARSALALGFLFSGVVHELVISLPAQGGWGGPTVFFLLQGTGVFVERSTLGQHLGLARGLSGWTFTMFVLLAPLGLLFHSPFVRGVVVPFLDWIVRA